jgi:drug/metabolite transporter (DMT)-like permease
MSARSVASPVVRAAVWMTGALASFTGMAIAARQLSFHMGTFEILFFRSLVGLAIVAPLVLWNRVDVFRASRLGLQIGRNAIHFAGQFCWVIGVAVLPLAQVFAIEFTMPIWVAFMAAFFLRERLTGPRMVAVIGGFIGVLIIVRPGLAGFNPASVIVLAGAIFFAASVVMTKVLTRTDSTLAILFFMAVVQLPMGLVPALRDWVTPGIGELPWILLIGVAALTAHYTLTRALRIADASVILPIDFMRVPIVAVVGFLIYSEALDPWVFVGALVIFASNYYVVRAENRPVAPAHPH